jgi:hypothetical protein
MRIATPATPEQSDLETRRALAEVQRTARANAGLADTVDRLVFGLFGALGNTVRPAALVTRSTAVTVQNGTDTLPTFDTPVVDTDGVFDPTIGDRLTIQTPGVYVAAGSAPWTANGTGLRVLDVLALGTNPVSNVIAGNSDTGIAAGPNLMGAVSAPFPFDAGSEVHLNLYQTSGGPLSTLTGYGGLWIALIYLQPLP